jgi:glutamate-1-semialdehyde 2,1-aminomutase
MSATVVGLDRARIRELTERERKRLDESTRGSQRMFERARRALPGGVASSYQLREPCPIYFERGEGPRVWDVDGREMWDFHNGFGSTVQGHAHPAIIKAVSDRIAQGTHFAAPTEEVIEVAEELARRWGLPRWRFTNSGTEATMDAVRIARGLTGRDTVMKIFGSYHGHHDALMVSIGRRLLPDWRSRRSRLASVRRRHPAVDRGPDRSRSLRRRRSDGAPDRAARLGGA